MKFAISAKSRVQPIPGATGICQCCGSALIAKCGTQKVWHWAHESKQFCDKWWEPETNWHRDWKNLFPEELQEVIQTAPDGEKHIADVKLPSGTVIEFQHSSISDSERRSREEFYKDMFWIVDGRRNKNDLKRFEKGFSPPWPYWRARTEKLIHWIDCEWYFPKMWLNSKVKVLFDFGFIQRPGDYEHGKQKPQWKSDLICLFPRSQENHGQYQAEFRRILPIKRSDILKTDKAW